jgi:hypothetical protein
MVPHSLNVAHSDGGTQILWKDGERVFHRGWRLDDDGKRREVLIAIPAANHPSRSSLERFAHEYELKDELDATWAVRPAARILEHQHGSIRIADEFEISVARSSKFSGQFAAQARSCRSRTPPRKQVAGTPRRSSSALAQQNRGKHEL